MTFFRPPLSTGSPLRAGEHRLAGSYDTIYMQKLRQLRGLGAGRPDRGEHLRRGLDASSTCRSTSPSRSGSTRSTRTPGITTSSRASTRGRRRSATTRAATAQGAAGILSDGTQPIQEVVRMGGLLPLSPSRPLRFQERPDLRLQLRGSDDRVLEPPSGRRRPRVPGLPPQLGDLSVAGGSLLGAEPGRVSLAVILNEVTDTHGGGVLGSR